MNYRENLNPVTNGHVIFRGGKSKKFGKTIQPFTYDNFLKDEFSENFNRERTDISDDIVMVPVFSFGASNLFLPVHATEYAKYIEHFMQAKNRKFSDEQIPDSSSIEFINEGLYAFAIGKYTVDTPMTVGENTICKLMRFLTSYSKYAFNYLVNLYTIQELSNELNAFYTENSSDSCVCFNVLKVNIDAEKYERYADADDDEYTREDEAQILSDGVPYVFDEITSLICPIDAKYILSYNGNYRFCNTFCHTDFTDFYAHIYIKIGNTNIWQRISIKDYEALLRIEALKVIYSKVNKPRAFDKIFYTQEYGADSVQSIVRMSVLIGLDLDYNALLESIQSININRERSREANWHLRYDDSWYDAITLQMDQLGCMSDVTLSQKELGLKTESLPLNGNRYRILKSNPIETKDRNDFCLLNLILSIEALHRSMRERSESYEYYEN